MKKILFAILILLPLAAFSQKNQYKATGISYTKTTPNWTPARGTEGEIAIDSLTGKWYQYSYQSGAWVHLGYFITETGTYGVPSYTPNKVKSVMAINSGDSLYHYHDGNWYLAAGGGGGGGVSDGDKGDIDVTIGGTVWTIDTNAITTIKIADDAVIGDKIAQDGATSGQVLKWNGSTWAPANDDGGGHVLANAGSALADRDTADFLDTGDIDFTLANTSTKTTIVADVRANVIDSLNIATGALSVTDLGQHGASSGQVLKWNGIQWAPSSDSTGSGTYIRYQYESAIVDTIPVPIGAKTVSVVLVGAGGGGGSGRRGAAGTNRGGGGGGGGGAVTVGDFDLSDIGDPSSLVLNCGTGGAGGAARTSDDTNGAAGSNGGTTSLTTLSGGVIAHALGGYAGSGGTTSGGGGGAGGGYGMFAGPSGGSGGNPGGFSVGPCSGAGGGGGGITGGNLGATGGAGGGGWYFIAVGASGGTPGVAGTNSSDPGIGRWGTNGAGGGGSSGTDGIAGGAGGNGTHGAGGGGGAASRNNNNSGAGGTGGDGYAIVMFTMTDDTIGMFSAGTGISIDTNYVITNTGDTNASDDLTTATSFSGDVSGTYNNLQIGAGAVGNTELASTAVDSTKVPVGALSVTDLGQHGASTNDFLTWNGTQWRSQTNSDLVAVEGLSGTGIAVRTASNTWTNRTITAGTGISVSNGDGVSGNPTVSADTSLLATVNDLNIAATQVAFGSASGSITGSNTLAYETNTVSMYPSANDTLLAIHGTGSIVFGVRSFTDPYNGAVNAYDVGGLTDDSRVFLRGYGIYPKAPFYQEQTAGIGFRGTTGNMYLHTNGDYYTATVTGDNGTTNRNVSYYFESGGATTGYGNPVIFHNIFSNNDSTGNGFEFISRNTASGGVTIADSTLMRFTSWDRGIQFNLTQRGRLGLQTRSPLYSLDINDTDGIRVPRGTTAQRPAGTPAGVVRFNTDSTALEVATGSAWTVLGSGGAGGGVSDGDKGDITVSSSGTVWDIDAGVVGNTELGSGAGGIFKGDGTLPAGTTNATLPSSGILRVEYNGGDAGLIVDDANSTSSVFSKDGTQFLSADNTQVLIGSGTSKMEYIDGVLRVYDSDATQYVAIQTPATGSLTSNYTLTLPVDDGTSGQYLQTNGSGGLSWQTVSGAGDILNGGNTTGATVTIGTNDAQSLSLETNNTVFFTANSSGNVALGSTPGGMRLAVNLTDASTSGTPIALQSKLTLSPGSNSSISSRSLNMSNNFDAAGINFTGNPQAAWFENRVINAGDFTGHLYGIFTSGLLMGGDAVSIGTVTNASGISLTPVSSFSNSVSGTVTNARGGYVRNAGKGSLTITNQAGINIEALSAATNNTSILLGTTTIPSGNYGIYSTVTDSSIFSGPIKAYGLIATATFAATNTITDRVLLQTNTSGSVGAGQGGGILFQGESSTNENQDQARIAASWTTTTHASREAKVGIQLGDNGGALAEIANFNVSGSNTGQLSIGSSSAVTIQNFGITTAASFTVGGSSSSLTLGGSSGIISISTSSTSSSAIVINPSSNNVAARIAIGTTTNDFNFTSGEKTDLIYLNDYVPTSGTGIYNAQQFSGQINQTGGASGITRGSYYNQTITAATDFRAIEIAANNSNAKGVYQTGSSTTNNFVGKTRFGGTTTPDDAVEVEGNIELVTAGNKIKIATGSNASAGVSGAMTAGSITISTTAVTANSLIFLTHATVGGTKGILSVGTITAGTSFVINSSSASDTGTVNWLIIN